jgi:hypothetical protein
MRVSWVRNAEGEEVWFDVLSLSRGAGIKGQIALALCGPMQVTGRV